MWGFVGKIVNLMLMWPRNHGNISISGCNEVKPFECSTSLKFSSVSFSLKANVEMMDSCRVMTRLGLLALGTLLWANTYCWVCLCMSTPLWKDSLSPWMSNLGPLTLQKDPLVCLWKQTLSVWIWRGTLHPFNSVFGVSLALGVSDPMER